MAYLYIRDIPTIIVCNNHRNKMENKESFIRHAHACNGIACGAW